MKFVAIDIGSNAVRLLLSNVYDNGKATELKKVELIRIPLRLGEDAFLRGYISEGLANKFVSTMKAFKYLIEVYEPVSYRACATSAMRDASNGSDIIKRVKDEASLDIEIINGKIEAELICSNRIGEYLEQNKSYLYIDIGGGSTEITIFIKGIAVASRSFNIGSIRVLHDQIDKARWDDLKDWIAMTTQGYNSLTAIGSGGNINKLYKMIVKKQNRPMKTSELREIYQTLSSYTYEERVKKLELNPDRADVIVPATKILLTALKSAKIDAVIVPQIGLSDGIVYRLYEEYKRGHSGNMDI